MKSFLQKISFAYDHLTERFDCREVQDTQGISQCLALRKKVFLEEMGRTKDGKSPGDQDEWDEHCVHILCFDTKTEEAIGAVRVIHASQLSSHKEMIQEYRLDLFPPEVLQKILVVSRLVVLPEYRKSPAALALACACCEFAYKNQISLGLHICEPNFYPMYRKLGYRPLSSVGKSLFGGYRLPLYVNISDYAHLKSVGSPFWNLGKTYGFLKDDEIDCWEKSFREAHSEDEVGFHLHSGKEELSFEALLLEDLSADSTELLLKNAVSIQCQFGDVVIAKDAACKNFGVIKKGSLQVKLGEGQNVVLGEGDVFGEVAFLLDCPRTADLVAATDDTEVILFSRSAIEKIKKEDQILFWKNLAKVLAKKLIHKNEN